MSRKTAWPKTCWLFIKREAVLCIAALCAIVSMFWVPPSAAYADYLDIEVLCLLFCFMAVVNGMQKYGLFDLLTRKLLNGCAYFRPLAVILVLLPFFCSMFVTNDVALLTFVPFTITLIAFAGCSQQLIYLIVLQTVAANMGSMLTPFGNPQNLFLYAQSQLSWAEFTIIVLPFVLVSFVLLLVAALLVKNQPITVKLPETQTTPEPRRLSVLAVLFVLCLLAVFHIVHFLLVTAIIIISLLFMAPDCLRRVDYSLLLTFICFFIFSGNIGNIDAVHDFISGIVSGHTVGVAVLLSQLISNVPAAIFLSGFTNDYGGLIIGTDIGGLGTLIASLASLISFRFYIKTTDAKPGKYLGVFTIANVIGLAVLLGVLALVRIWWPTLY